MTKLNNYDKWEKVCADEDADDSSGTKPVPQGIVEPDASYLQSLETSDADEIFRKQQEIFAQEGEQERVREKDLLAPGRWVILKDLKASHLNGCRGEVVAMKNADGRVGVRLEGHGDKLIMVDNVTTYGDSETIKIVRVGSRGEENGSRGPGGVRTWRWPRSALEALPSEISPISELLGFPLMVSRVGAHAKLEELHDFDNQWATSFMAEPISGLAPVQWQTQVGPVVLWRQSGEPFSADDACLFQSFISDLMRMYPGVNVQEAITPEVFQEFMKCKLAAEKANPHMEQSTDVNI